jgi:hypothetical protein
MTLQQFCHFGLAIERKHIRPRTSRGIESEEENSDCKDGIANPWDKGASHSTDIAIRKYAVESGFTKALTPDLVELCVWFSRLYHRCYNLLSADVPAAKTNTPMEFLLTGDENKKEIERIMKLWYDTRYKWKSQQQQASTEHVVSCISPLFIVLPTFVGKTVTFLPPAKMRGAKTTVVITPLIALGLLLLLELVLTRQYPSLSLNQVLFPACSGSCLGQVYLYMNCHILLEESSYSPNSFSMPVPPFPLLFPSSMLNFKTVVELCVVK